MPVEIDLSAVVEFFEFSVVSERISIFARLKHMHN